MRNGGSVRVGVRDGSSRERGYFWKLFVVSWEDCSWLQEESQMIDEVEGEDDERNQGKETFKSFDVNSMIAFLTKYFHKW